MFKKIIAAGLMFNFLNLHAQDLSFAQRQIKDFPLAYKTLQDKIDEIKEECKVVTKKDEDARSFLEKNQRWLAMGGAAILSGLTIYVSDHKYNYYSRKAVHEGSTGERLKNSANYASKKTASLWFSRIGKVFIVLGPIIAFVVANPGDVSDSEGIDKITFTPKLFGAEILNMNTVAIDSLVKANISISTPLDKLIDQAETLLDLCELMNKK